MPCCPLVYYCVNGEIVSQVAGGTAPIGYSGGPWTTEEEAGRRCKHIVEWLSYNCQGGGILIYPRYIYINIINLVCSNPNLLSFFYNSIRVDVGASLLSSTAHFYFSPVKPGSPHCSPFGYPNEILNFYIWLHINGCVSGQGYSLSFDGDGQCAYNGTVNYQPGFGHLYGTIIPSTGVYSILLSRH